ncbi:tetratricopeptide repeat family protein [Collimonas arenae]|uniref:Tetratricopeptide repeat family protein n=1 Tax=Collimonas arenae TaxID=279058 RepID=A0A127PN47_9BURK|nr:tetratricopeptide repeat protein [Collimonas arenae]AMO99024.1 tetratricopeptide repeat family protein [Collimonas arenae]AMP08920.1 tetratricopeptide repeat family protein [Collimonas arenae]
MTITSLDYFTSLVQQANDVPLFEAALAIAQDAYPKLDFDAPQNELDRLANTLRQRLPSDASAIQKLRLLNHFFFQELGFAINVNHYYDVDNSYLHRVIAKRRGIPISLALVYMELAQQIGLPVKGVSFPGHFLMKLTIPSGDIMIDPANGASLSREELEERLEPYLPTGSDAERAASRISLITYLQAAHPHDILVRMLRNLKAIFQQNKQWQRLLEVQQRLLILLPGDAVERRDRGQAYSQLDCPQAALEDLENYLAQRPLAADAEQLQQQAAELREACRRLN